MAHATPLPGSLLVSFYFGLKDWSSGGLAPKGKGTLYIG
jgi:hypothetical protein